MGQVIPRQHPAVALKSHFKAVRALLVVALVALAATVAILATNDTDTNVSIAPKSAQVLQPGARFDGGPDEGTRGPQTDAPSASPLSSDQAPDEGSSEQATPPVIPMGPGGR